MQILGVGILNAYARRRPQARKYVLAFRALVSAASWQRFKDIEMQFGRVAVVAPQDRVVFDFADENLRIEMRVNCALGLARVLSTGPSANKTVRAK